MNPLRDEELIRALNDIKKKDPAAFMKMILAALKKYPELAVDDDAPTAEKIKALESLLKYFEGVEEYEDCAFILNLKQKIIECQKIKNT